MIGAAILACAAGLVHPVTMQAVIEVESHGNPIAINVNGVGTQHPHDAAEAVAIAQRYLARGYSVDLGLTQINSANLASAGLTVETALDPCLNVRAGASILAADYEAAVRRFGEGQGALAAALSAYNTGTFERGFRNGYVARYTPFASDQFRQKATKDGNAGQDRPLLAVSGHSVPLSPYTADTSVFTTGAIHVAVE